MYILLVVRTQHIYGINDNYKLRSIFVFHFKFCINRYGESSIMKQFRKRQKTTHEEKVNPFFLPPDSQLHIKYRFKAFALLKSACANDLQYARSIESSLYTAAHNDGRLYEEGIRRVVFALARNTSWMQRYDAETLASLDEYTLAQGTPMEGWFDKLEKRRQRQEQLLADGVTTNEDPGTSSLKCGRCKSTCINIEQKQTRGADEAMTVFATCEKCQLRWRM